MMKVEMKGKPEKSFLAFKNGAVYPIKIFNLAYSIFYVKSLISAEARNTPLNWSGPDHYDCNPFAGRSTVPRQRRAL